MLLNSIKLGMEEEKQEPKRQRKYKKRNKLLKNLQDQVSYRRVVVLRGSNMRAFMIHYVYVAGVLLRRFEFA